MLASAAMATGGTSRIGALEVRASRPSRSRAVPVPAEGYPRRGRANAKGWSLLLGPQIEDLAGDVLDRVDAAHERPHLAPRDPLDGLPELRLGRVLEEHPRVAQAVVLAHRDHVPLGRGE